MGEGLGVALALQVELVIVDAARHVDGKHELKVDFLARGQAMPRRLDRLALLPQGAQVWPAATGGEPGWMLEAEQGPIAVLPAGSARLGDLIDQPGRRGGAARPLAWP